MATTKDERQHTPGPWDVTSFRVYATPHERVVVICDTATNKMSRTRENAANAVLIAAAPEMLAFAEDQLKSTNCICRIQSKLKGTHLENDLECTHCRAEKLIKKAKGER